MLHLAIIVIVCAVSAPNEGIVFIRRKNNGFNTCYLSDEKRQSITKVILPSIYNVNIYNASDCAKQKITNRTSSFYDYFINQYQRNKNNSCSITESVPLDKKKNFSLDLNFSFRKRNLLWKEYMSTSKSLMKNEKRQRRYRKKKKRKIRSNKTKAKELKGAAITNEDSGLNQEEKKLFLKLKNLKNRYPGHLYFFEMKNLNLDQRIQRLNKKMELENRLREEKLLHISTTELPEKQKNVKKPILKDLTKSVSFFNKPNNIFSLRKNPSRYWKQIIDDNSAFFSVNNVRHENPVTGKMGSIRINDFPKTVQETLQNSEVIKNPRKLFSEICDLGHTHQKNLVAKPYPYSANVNSKINFLKPISQTCVSGKKKRGHHRIRSAFHKSQKGLKNWPFFEKLIRNHSRVNNTKINDGLARSGDSGILRNNEKTSKCNENFRNSGEITMKKIHALKRNQKIDFSSLNMNGEVKDAITEATSVLTSTQKYEILFDHTIEKPFLQRDFQNQMQSSDFKTLNDGYNLMTDSPLFNSVFHQFCAKHKCQISSDKRVPTFHYLKVRHALRTYLTHNNLWKPSKKYTLMNRKKRCGKSCSAPQKCWRTAPLLCIPYIKKGQEDVLLYLIDVMKKMLGKPLPPKNDIFGKTKYKPTKMPQNSCDDSCEDDYEAEKPEPSICRSPPQGTTSCPYPTFQVQSKNSSLPVAASKIPSTTSKITSSTPSLNKTRLSGAPKFVPGGKEMRDQSVAQNENQFPNQPLLFIPTISPPICSFCSSRLVVTPDKTSFSGCSNPDNINSSTTSHTTATMNLVSGVTESSAVTTSREPSLVSTMNSLFFSNSPIEHEDYFSFTPHSYNGLPEIDPYQYSDLITPRLQSEELKALNNDEKKSQVIGIDPIYENSENSYVNVQDMLKWPPVINPSRVSTINEIFQDLNQPETEERQINLKARKKSFLEYPFKPYNFRKNGKVRKFSSSKYLNNRKGLYYDDYLFDENLLPHQEVNFDVPKKRLFKMMHQKKLLKQNLNSAVAEPNFSPHYYSYEKYPFPSPGEIHKKRFKKHPKKKRKYYSRRDKYLKMKDLDHNSLARRKREDDYIWPEIYNDYLDDSNYKDEYLKKRSEISSDVSDENPSDSGWTPPSFDMFSELAEAVAGLATTESESEKIAGSGNTTATNNITVSSTRNMATNITKTTYDAATTNTIITKTTTVTVFESITTTVPTSTVPTSTVPTSTVPISTVPTSTVSTSTVPTSTVPTSTVPTSTVPTSTVPTSTGPTSTVPTSTVSASTLLASTLLASTVSASTVSASTVPASTVQASTVPTSIVPASTIPSYKKPSSMVFESKKFHETLVNQKARLQSEGTRRQNESINFANYDYDNLTLPSTKKKNISNQSVKTPHSFRAHFKSSKKIAGNFTTSKCVGKSLGSGSQDSLKSGKMSFFQTSSKTNQSKSDSYTEKASKKDSKKEEKGKQDTDIGDGQVPTTLKTAIIVKGSKKLLTKPSPKVYSKVFPDSFDFEIEANEGIATTAVATSKPFLESKTALLSSTLKPDIRLQLLAVCEGYLEIIKRLKALNQTFGEELDAELARYCESIISQSFNTQLEKVKKVEPNESQTTNSGLNTAEEAEGIESKLNLFLASQAAYENDKEFSEAQVQEKVADDKTKYFVPEKENKNDYLKEANLKNLNEERNSTETDSYLKTNRKKKKRRKKQNDLSKSSLKEETEEGLLKKGITEEQIKLIHLLKKRKRALISWLMNSKDHFKTEDLPETEYFEDEDFIPPDSDFSEYSGTIKPKRNDNNSETMEKALFRVNETILPIYAKLYGYDKGGELREVEVLWRKVNEKTHEEEILKNISVIAFLMTSTNSPIQIKNHEETKLLGKANEGEDVKNEGEDMPEIELENGNKVGFANEEDTSQDETSSVSSSENNEITTPYSTTNATESVSVSKKPKTLKLPKKNATHTFINKPDPSSIVGTSPNKTKIHQNITRKASHKFGVAKDLFQEYSIEFLNYAVYILPAMFTILFFFCCFGCALYILKTRKSFRTLKRKKKRGHNRDDTTETSEDSDDSRTKRKREAKRKKKHNDAEDEESEKKTKKKFWNVLKMSSKSQRELNGENGQSGNEGKNFLRFLKGKRDENRTEGNKFSKNYPDSGDESYGSDRKKDVQKGDANSEAVERKELISLLEELKKIELEQTGEKKEVKSVHVQYTIQEDENPFCQRPEFSYPYEKNVFGLPKGYFYSSKKFPCQQINPPVSKDFELYEDVSEMTELLPCECSYYSKKTNCLRHCDLKLKQDCQCKRFYKIYRDSGVNHNKPFTNKNFLGNNENQNYIFNKYRSVNTDTSEELIGVVKKNAGTEVRFSDNASPFTLSSKKNGNLIEEMEKKCQLSKKKYVCLKDDGVLCRL